MRNRTHFRPGSRTHFARRLWILGALFVALCALALVQYSWVNQLARAERQHAKARLAAALNDVASDFDIEITRPYMLFQLPSGRPADYAQRYKEWLRRAPYPNVIRGVYIGSAKQPDAPPKPVLPGEPAIRLAEWKRARAKPALPFAGAAAAGALQWTGGFRTATRGGVSLSFDSFHPEMRIAGNPAFILPILPAPGPGAVVTRRPGEPPPFPPAGAVRAFGPSEWLLVVLDGHYLRTTLLPKLLERYLPASVYDVQVIGGRGGAPRHFVFASSPALARARLAHPDGKIGLFQLRPDCFSSNPPPGTVRIVGNASDIALLSPGSVAEILSSRPATCAVPGTPGGGKSAGLWEMLVRYRAGSLDASITAFRDRNLLLGGSALLVLALGIAMLAVLTERARALAEMQAEFALGVSHELRTPLTVIRLAADNLRKGLVENVEQARKYGDIVHTHATELSNMIEETLAFARLHSPTLLSQPTLVSPRQIVKSVAANSQRALRDAGFHLELDVAPGLPMVSADARLLERCLENLVRNALKYAAAGRWIAIRARRVNRPKGERVEISVADRGPGISPADLPHVFEPFYRGKHGDQTQVPGVGLGLTLVKRVVEAHHGSVEIETSETAGTRFSIFLPPDRTHPESPAAE